MTKDDHAALIEVKGRLLELRAQHGEAKAVSNWRQLQAVEAQIDAAEAEQIDIMRRTEPEDEPSRAFETVSGSSPRDRAPHNGGAAMKAVVVHGIGGVLGS